MLTKDPFNTRADIKQFIEEASKHTQSQQDLNLLVSIFKLMTLLNIVISHNDRLNHKVYVQGIVYDTLNSVIAIITKRERYLQLNIRSMIEHIARIALNKIDNGGDFDGTLRIKNFDHLKESRSIENWKYMHETYTRACHYVHSSPQANLNITSTFLELLKEDYTSKPSKQILNLQKVISAVIRIFLIYYTDEVSSTFYRSQGELKFLLGNSLYAHYEVTSGRT